jgi:hypothetical protein
VACRGDSGEIAAWELDAGGKEKEDFTGEDEKVGHLWKEKN